MLKLKLLGTPTILLADRSVTFKTNKSQALLIYLAVNQRVHSRDMLADLLWTDMSNQQARKNLRDTLAYLRAGVGDYILVDSHTLTFNQHFPSAIDVNDFVAQVTRGRATSDLALIESGLHLYQADFLAGFQLANAPAFDQWAMQKGEELHTFATANLHWLATRYLQAAAYAAGLRVTQRLLTLEPWQESFHLLQMRLLALTGNRVAALRQFEICRQLLADELYLAPSATALALYEQIKDEIFPSPLADEPADTKQTLDDHKQQATQAADKTAPAQQHYPNNLPRQLTELVGRVAEIRALLASIDTGQPIITLVGEGGIGKSRLALAVAQRLLTDPQSTAKQRLRDGIWLVALADIVTTGIPKAVLRERVAARIGEALQLSFAGAAKLSSQLGSYLRNRSALLILDSFEHLMPVTDFVFELLQQAAGLQLLVTSRTTLGLRTEQVVEVSGLAVPPNVSDQAPWTELQRYDAIALFYTCAQRIRSDFTLNQDNVAAIVRICNFVAGSPLAIKLAAALLDIYSCAQLAALLVQDYMILSNEQLDLPERQRSMQSVLDTSWQYLERDQAHLLACCSLLQRMFTPAAAVAIAQRPAAQLHALVRHSWLRYDEKLQRFTMHELLHQYAARQLAQSPVQQAMAEQRYAEYHIRLLQSNELSVKQDPAVVELLRMAWRDIHTAWAWAIQKQRLDLLEQGAQGLANYYEIRGLLHEGEQAFALAVESVRQNTAMPQNTASQRTLTVLLCCLIDFHFYLGQQKELLAVANEALAWSRRLGDRTQQTRARNGLARVAQLSGNYAEMRRLAQQTYTRLDQHTKPELQAQTHNIIAIAFWASGDFEQGIVYFHKALEYLRQAPDIELEARVNMSLGYLYHRQKKPMPAHVYLAEALRLAQLFHGRRTIGITYLYLGDLWRELGAYARSEVSYAQAAEILSIIGDAQWHGWLHASYGRLLHLQGNQVGARVAYHLALELVQGKTLGFVEYRSAILLGHLLAAQGALTEAATFYQRARILQQQLNILHSVPDLYTGLAAIYLARNEKQAAQRLIDKVLKLVVTWGIEIAEEPAQVYGHCIAVLEANRDPRADTLRSAAQQYVQQKASQIDDAELRYTFLHKVVANRRIVEGGGGGREGVDR